MLDTIREQVCAALCPSVWTTVQPHCPTCIALRAIPSRVWDFALLMGTRLKEYTPTRDPIYQLWDEAAELDIALLPEQNRSPDYIAHKAANVATLAMITGGLAMPEHEEVPTASLLAAALRKQEQPVTVGRIVHFIHDGRHLAATITDVAFAVREPGKPDWEGQALTVFPPMEPSFTTVALQGEREGTWHWPEFIRG